MERPTPPRGRSGAFGVQLAGLVVLRHRLLTDYLTNNTSSTSIVYLTRENGVMPTLAKVLRELKVSRVSVLKLAVGCA